MKVLVSDPIHEKGLDMLREFAEVEVSPDLEKDELLEVVPEFDAMVVRSGTKVRKDVLDAAENLKIIVRAGVGLDNIDLEYAEERGIEVQNTPEASTAAVAELAIGFMLSWARNISQADKTMKEGRWEKSGLAGTELRDKTLGLIGTGRIGVTTAKRAKSFDMDIIGYDPVKRDEFREVGGEYVDLDELLKKSDYLSLHVPLTSSTENIIGKEELDKMKDTSVIVNTARGGVVNEEALVDALEKGQIAGACLDVYEENPVDTGRFLGMSNVVLAPHLGAFTAEAQEGVAVLAAEKIREKLG